MRKFIKGGEECAPEMFRRIRGSDDLYGSRSAEASINFITCHDGFTLYDLVSYNEKHNEQNGEKNQDGANDNNSWNCGVEGDTDDENVLDLRFRQMRNMFTILLTSRGIPMLLAGDEFANTQWGNNNAYCQDNEISWIDWSYLDKNHDLYDYVRKLIQFRKIHPVISEATYDFAHNGTGYPELSFHGTIPWDLDENAPGYCFSYMYSEDHVEHNMAEDTFIYVAVNAHWEEHWFEIPVLPEEYRWRLSFNTEGYAAEPGKERELDRQDGMMIKVRTIVVLIGEK